MRPILPFWVDEGSGVTSVGARPCSLDFARLASDGSRGAGSGVQGHTCRRGDRPHTGHLARAQLGVCAEGWLVPTGSHK